MKLNNYLKRISEVPFSERQGIIETITIQSYGSNILTETDMWILRTAAENEEYLNDKLSEAGNTIKLDSEAPEEIGDIEANIESLDADDELPEVTDAGSTDNNELPSIDVPSELLNTDNTETSDIEVPSEPVSTNVNSEDSTLPDDSSTDVPEQKIETSLAGVGILPLLAEIQEKLANGKPSEVELAALKAMKKLF